MVIERGPRGSYLLAIVKFILFLIAFCFLVEFAKGFWAQAAAAAGFNKNVFILSVMASFVFSEFIADLSGLYKRIQHFFFRSSFIMVLFPALLIVLGVGYFFLPKVLGVSFNKDVFLFLGGFIFTSHLRFVARETKGYNFSVFINYIFIFSVLFILNLVLLSIYLKVAFNVHIAKIIIEGLRSGVALIQHIFIRALH